MNIAEKIRNRIGEIHSAGLDVNYCTVHSQAWLTISFVMGNDPSLVREWKHDLLQIGVVGYMYNVTICVDDNPPINVLAELKP